MFPFAMVFFRLLQTLRQTEKDRLPRVARDGDIGCRRAEQAADFSR